MDSQKKYYSIGEVSQMMNFNQSKLRYWEQQFSAFIKPKRTRRGDRMYTLRDIENLKLINHLVTDLHFTLEGAKQYLRHHKKELEAKIEVIERLKRVKAELERLKESLDY
jgi:DNA-binding transcriptional MerR regulator